MSSKILQALVFILIFGFVTFFSSCNKDESAKTINEPDSIVNISTGLIGYYLFTGNAMDSSGAHNNGTNVGASLVPDRNGVTNQAFIFNGTSYIDLPVNAFKNDTYTYAVWLNITTLPGDGDIAVPISIGQKDDTDPNGHPHQAISLANDYATAQAYGFNAGGYNIGSPTTSSIETNILPELGRWYHVVAVRNSSQIALYIDGKIIGASSTNLTLPDYGTSTAARIGIRANLTQGFSGVIDDVRIYNRALSDKEVSTIYWTSKPK